MKIKKKDYNELMKMLAHLLQGHYRNAESYGCMTDKPIIHERLLDEYAKSFERLTGKNYAKYLR